MSEIIKDVRYFLKTEGFLNEHISLKEDDSLTETGVIDSIILLQLVDFLESKYKIEIPPELLTPENFDTLAGISQSVKKLIAG
ncbi:MAG: acyl carrier protein [Methanoregula sp.]|jgi:acyl carrier protein|nr:acyl carrier protein [Methanoregula sp.]